MTDESDFESALVRLLAIARHDTGQSRRVAAFLLAWWNSEDWKGWNVTDIWNLDRNIVDDILIILKDLRHLHGFYPCHHRAALEAIMDRHPDLRVAA